MTNLGQGLFTRGEIIKRAQLLIKGKGEGALDYSSKMAARMEETGDQDDIVYWEEIAKQVELLLYENH